MPTGSIKWICVPLNPAGCGPANSSTITLLACDAGILLSGALHKWMLPSCKRLNTVKPLTKSFSDAAIITAGSAARGLVSIALTKMDEGTPSIAGTLLNGRVRNAVHKPDSCKFLRTCSALNVFSSAVSYLSKESASLPSTLITTDCNTRFSPRWIAVIVPLAGAVKITPGFFLSSKSTWPFFTTSPSRTFIEGRIPTYSSPSKATSVTVFPLWITCSGFPAIGRSKPFLIVIILFALLLLD